MSTASAAPDPFGADRPTGRIRRTGADRPGTPDAADAHPSHVGTDEAADTAEPRRVRGPGSTANPLATAATAAAGATVAAALPWSFPPGGGETTFDLAVNERVDPRLDPRPWIAEVLTLATNTGVVLAVLCGGAAWFAWQRKWWETATMVLVPETAVAINAWALKPFWSRPLHDYLAYPSGHTVHLVAVVTTLVLLLRSVRARAVIVALTAAAWFGAGIGMVALDYHLATDVLGGAAAGIALAIGLYWVAVYLARPAGARSG
ncbi:phosphatase PAP2 family protein [Nocardia fusca]|uniref:phosphatase PAP2 family protein n=1 Tax=Nocardia fusca TaxID=941183 RepID=UPI000AD59471|nr:phosphatase PAP2 family protein [Nocardia fusca]